MLKSILITLLAVFNISYANEVEQMRIKVVSNDKTIVYKLNDSDASKSLYSMLPMTVEVKPYSDNEMTFTPINPLKTTNTPLSQGIVGTLAYFAPWDGVVMFYKAAGPYRGLYDLGKVESGFENISQLSNSLTIDKAD